MSLTAFNAGIKVILKLSPSTLDLKPSQENPFSQQVEAQLFPWGPGFPRGLKPRG